MKMGMGDYTFMNGDKYSGEFINEQRDGKGSYTWREGEKLEGWWRGDRLNGEAKFIDKGK
jgi:hypothetical protein